MSTIVLSKIQSKTYFAKPSTKGQVVIPKSIRDALGINQNTQLVISLQDNVITFTKHEDNLDSVFGALGKKVQKQTTKPITQNQFQQDLQQAKSLYFQEKKK